MISSHARINSEVTPPTSPPPPPALYLTLWLEIIKNKRREKSSSECNAQTSTVTQRQTAGWLSYSSFYVGISR